MLAVVALLLALGLPWGVAGPESEYVAGWVTPMFCTPGADGVTLDCTPGFVSPGFTVAGQGAAYAGYQTSARVTIVLALVLVALWWRGGATATWPLVAAAALQVASVALVGSALRSGAMAALLAAVVLVVVARAGRRVPAGPDREATPAR